MTEASSSAFVGMDVHKNEIVVSILEGRDSAVFEQRVSNTEKGVRRFARRLSKKYGDQVACVYEAGACGFAVQRQMAKEGVRVELAAPSLIPRKPGMRIKSDRRDALQLAEHLRSGSLTFVREPSEDEESARDLCRCRMSVKADQTRARHRLTKWLLRRGLAYRGGSHWTLAHRFWLNGLEHANRLDRAVFEELLGEVEHQDERLLRADESIEQLAQSDPWKETVGRLRCFRGIDTISAMVIATEVFDFRRFQKARSFMGYLGLVPGLRQSGDMRKGLGLTKTGNPHVRRILIQAAWNSRGRPRVGAPLRRRRAGQDEAVIRIADKAQSRLHRRYRYLAEGRGKARNKVIAAMARELAGFIWAAMLVPGSKS